MGSGREAFSIAMATASMLLLLLLRLRGCRCEGGMGDVGVGRRGNALREAVTNAEASILLEFRAGLSTEEPYGVVFDGWAGHNVCGWQGVTCDGGGHVAALNLSGWNVVGPLSPRLGELQYLSYLNLSRNCFQGSIPIELGALGKLETLDLSYNNISGSIPGNLSGCSSLRWLDLTTNSLAGVIPQELGFLQSLEFLSLSSNAVEGSIPESLGNCSSLSTLLLDDNFLRGELPAQLSGLRRLEVLSLYGNSLEGSIPVEIANCTALKKFRMGLNQLNGDIPPALGRLSNLQYLHLASNNLSGTIPPELGNCEALVYLKLSSNQLVGYIPASLGGLPALQHLNLERNHLVGEIPKEVGNCSKLINLHLSRNSLHGAIPPEIGNLSALAMIHLDENGLTGFIPEALGHCKALTLWGLRRNFLSGGIPEFIISNPSIVSFDLSHNIFTGPIPSLIGGLQFAYFIDLSSNGLTGSIPASFASCTRLQRLDLSNNALSGQIPSSLAGLKELVYLNVSMNRLSGPIPRAFSNFPSQYFSGNLRLCGLPADDVCPGDGHQGSGGWSDSWIYTVAAVSGLAIGIFALGIAIWFFSKTKKVRLSHHAGNMLVFTEDLKLTVPEVIAATNGFSDSNILGWGSKSTVYGGVLPSGLKIAVKRLNIDHHSDRCGSKLQQELQVLGLLRHRNLLKIHGFSSSSEMLALILEYMPNGSLHRQLHGCDNCDLTWKMRLDIAVGIADGLVHLHHECAQPIIHLDIKPTNILLDEHFVAKVADFRISKFVHLQHSGETTLTALYGTTGYIPPEYRMSTKVSVKGDVYNYGILILELLTRKRPTDDFHRNISLRQWVSEASDFPEDILLVIDRAIQNELAVHENQIHLMLRVGLLCTQDSPHMRPSMIEVRELLRQIESLSNHTKK